MLEYGINFNTEDGAKKAAAEIEKWKREWEKVINGKPLEFKPKANTEELEGGIKTIKGHLRELRMMFNQLELDSDFESDGQAIIEMFNELKQQTGLYSESLDQAAKKQNAIASESLTTKLKILSDRWNELSLAQRKGAEGTELIAAFSDLTEKADIYAKSLSNVVRAQQVASETKTLSQQLADLSAHWERLSASQRKGLEGDLLIRQFREISGSAGEYVGSLRDVIRAQDELKKKSSTVSGQLQILEERWAELSIQQRKGAEGKEILKEYKSIQKEAGVYLGTIRETLAEKKKIKDKILATAKAEAAAAAAAADANGRLKKQSDLMRSIRNYAGQFLSVYAGVRMFKALSRITGQFEMQKVALQAILQSADKGSAIFEQIKGLAIVSPFEFKDLISYTKQLSAFSIPYNELYDTTKALADLSAGLGVDMNRLIIAYGQVRSAAVLRGQELRQFTEAGIPLVQEIADKFTELNGELVTTGEVFELISRRQVSFGMVKDILMDMTSEGGRFFDMQEKQAATLQGKLSNLKDAYEIFLSEVGGEMEGFLKGSIDGLRWLMEHYQKVIDILVPLAVGYGALRASTAALNALQAANITSMKRFLVVVRSLTRSVQSFDAAQKAAAVGTGWGVILAAVAAVGTALYIAARRASELKREINSLVEESRKETLSDTMKLDYLIRKLKDSNRGTQEYRDAIDQLNREYKDFLPRQIKISDSFTDIKNSADLATIAINNNARAVAQQKGSEKIFEDYSNKAEKYMVGVEKAIKSYARGRSDEEVQSIVDKYVQFTTDNSEQVLSDFGTFIGEIRKMLNEDLGVDLKREGVGVEVANNLIRLAYNSKEARSEIDKLNRRLSALYSGSQDIGKKEKALNEAHQARLEAYKKEPLTEEAYNAKVRDAELSHLKELYKMYEMAGMEKTERARDVMKNIQDIQGEEVKGWKKVVSEFTEVETNANRSLKLGQDDFAAPEYIKRVTGEYEKLKEEYEIYSKLKDEDSAKTLADIEAQMRATEKLSELVGFSLTKEEDDGGGGKDPNTELNAMIKAAERLSELRAKMALEEKKYALEVRQADIESTKDGAAYKIAMIELERDKELLSIEERKQAMINANLDIARAKWESEGGNGVFSSEVQLTKEQEELIAALRKGANDKYIADDKAVREEVISRYRDYGLKKLAIEEQLSRDIADIETQRAKDGNEITERRIREAKKIADEGISDMQRDILSKYGLDGFFSDGDMSDFIKDKIRATLPLFKSISTATLGELEKIKEVLSEIEFPQELIDDFEAAGGDVLTLVNLIAEAIKNGNEAVDERIIDKLIEGVDKMVGSLGKLSSALEDTSDSFLSSIGRFMNGIAGGLGDITELIKLGDKATFADQMSTGISGLATIVSTVSSHIKANAEAQKEWNDALMESEQRMRMLRIEQDAYKDGIFGMGSPIAPAVAGVKKYMAAMEELSKMTGELGEGLVQIGNEKVPSDSAFAGFVAGGAGVGAAVGSIVPALGTAIGAVVGGLLGGVVAGISSLFGSKASTKLVPVFKKLKDQYAWLYNEGFELNPEIIADYDKLDDATKAIVDNWEEIQAKAKEAQEQIEETLANIAGSIGEDLYSALIEAFDNKDLDSAMNKFRNSVNRILSDFAGRMLFSAVFGDILDKGEERMKNSLGADGDQNLVDDIDWLGDSLEGNIPAYLSGLESLSDMLSGLGRTLGFSDEDAETNLKGISKGVSAITEDTALVLGGYLNSIRMKMFEYFDFMMLPENRPMMSELMADTAEMVNYLREIEVNTKITAETNAEILNKVNSVLVTSETGKGWAINANV